MTSALLVFDNMRLSGTGGSGQKRRPMVVGGNRGEDPAIEAIPGSDPADEIVSHEDSAVARSEEDLPA